MKIDDFVDDFYSVTRFKAAYMDRIEPLPDRTQWPVVELGFKVFSQFLGRGVGRPKVQRYISCLEKNASKNVVRCK